MNIEAATAPEAIGGLGVYARVCSHGQKADLERRLMSFCVRLYGRRSAKDRARKALDAARYG
ncbi:hypothetical protein [Actinoallomurus sp. NPDC050550]|uniref:hypothetical protein n=1 Tax=Actinoallomurus sp. NPDC050550 TaxID=3154937 RepID=UPI0033DE2D6A